MRPPSTLPENGKNDVRGWQNTTSQPFGQRRREIEGQLKASRLGADGLRKSVKRPKASPSAMRSLSSHGSHLATTERAENHFLVRRRYSLNNLSDEKTGTLLPPICL